MAATAYGIPNWILVSAALAFAVVLYYLLRRLVPLWLLIPLVIVLASVGLLVAIIGTKFLSVVVLTLYPVLSGHVSGQITVGYVETSSPWWVYLLEGAAVLLIMAVVVYLIRRR